MSKLTGRTRFRAAEVVGLGVVPAPALVWQVQTVEYVQAENGAIRQIVGWRDAQVEDLCEINNVVYSTINVTVAIPQLGDDSLPGERPGDARKFH